MKKISTYLIVGGITLALILALVYMLYKSPIEVIDYDMHIEVGDNVGFNLDTDKIYFGTVYPGGGAERNITLTNIHDITLTTQITLSGDLKEWVVLSDNNFLLDPSKSKDITVYVTTPENTTYGNYTGKMKVRLLRSKS